MNSGEPHWIENFEDHLCPKRSPFKILNCLKLNWSRKIWRYVLSKRCRYMIMWCRYMKTVYKELIMGMKVSTHRFEESTHEDNGQFINEDVDAWLWGRGQSFENEWLGVDTWILGVDTCDQRTKFEKLMIKSRHMELKCWHMETMYKNWRMKA